MTHFDTYRGPPLPRTCYSCVHWDRSELDFGMSCKDRPGIDPRFICVWWEPRGGYENGTKEESNSPAKA